MRKLLIALFVGMGLTASAQQLDYYLPNNVTYNVSIPTPKSVIYQEVGEWHVTHDRLVNYMRAVATASNRIVLHDIGYTYEGRPQLVLIITSPENHARIDEIRKQHLLLSDPEKSASVNIENMPAVVWTGFSIHGNESSGANSSMLAVYYMAAAQGKNVDEILKNNVILLDPSFNPDGLNRFATWANMHKSKTMVSDPSAREFNEVWPGGRFNHYWFDLNRDWLPAQHVESQNRLKIFHEWKPNILTDHHEMGSNSSFFFQPGVPSRVNPNTPPMNQELTGLIGNFHAHNLDSIGSQYFTKEGYDDFYYGKGSTYPDVNGGIGILFEQASSRGHAQETDNGLLTFPFTIRNQFATFLSTIEAAGSLRKKLLNYQRSFYTDAIKDATAFPVNAYVFGDEKDKGKTQKFIEILLRHKIEIFALKQNINSDGQTFTGNSSFVIPTRQPQFKLIKAIFEKTKEYKDSLFYDVTSWTMPLAFNLPFGEYTGSADAISGNKINAAEVNVGKVIGGKSNYAYAFSWNEYFTPKLLYSLQKKGLKTKVATQLFQASVQGGDKKQFGYGTILISVSQQDKKPDEVFSILNSAAADAGIDIYGLPSGLSVTGIDLGSNSFANVEMPKIMMFGGTGTSALDVGEIWHMLDQKMEMPVSIVDVDRFNSVNASKYSVIIMPSGNYNNLSRGALEKLKDWVSGGGTLIATEDAVKYLANNGITKVLFKTDGSKKDSTLSLPFYLRSDEMRAKDLTGSIFEAKMELTHPLCYGYSRPSISIFKSSNNFMDQNNNPYDSPVMLTSNPLQSGYLFRGNKDLVKDNAVINIDQIGRGKVISMIDNLNFRAFWYGTTKMFMNAVFFGDVIRL